MNPETGNKPYQKKQLLLIFPLIYRPEKVNVARRFELLSASYYGHIFALSGARHRNIPLSGFHYHSEKFPSNGVVRFFLGLWFQVAAPIRMIWKKSAVDAILSYDPYRSGLAGLVLKYILRSKLVVEINGEFHTDYQKNEAGSNRIKGAIMGILPKVVLGAADALKVLNTDQEAYYKNQYPAKPIYRFHDFIPTEYFESLPTTQGDYFLSVGHPFYVKGMDILIKAFMKIAEKYPQIKLRIMGYSPDDELQQYKSIAQNHPSIEFIKPGWIEDVGQQLGHCYAFVNASRSEAMGRVFIEAMACGKPIIATRTNGGMLCVDDRVTGLLCNIEDIDDLAGKMNEILADPERAIKMGQAGLSRMQREFSESSYVRAFDAMINEVTGSQ